MIKPIDTLKDIKHIREFLEELGLSEDRKIEINMKLAEMAESQKAWEKWYFDYVRRPLRYQEFLFGCFWSNIDDFGCFWTNINHTVKRT